MTSQRGIASSSIVAVSVFLLTITWWNTRDRSQPSSGPKDQRTFTEYDIDSRFPAAGVGSYECSLRLGLSSALEAKVCSHRRLEAFRDLICGKTLFDPSYRAFTGTTPAKNVKPFDIVYSAVNTRGWPRQSVSMLSCAGIDNIRALLATVVDLEVDGDFFEAGVWRGGGSIFARLVLNELGATQRKVWVADSFAGLPPSSNIYDTDSWSAMRYLAVSKEAVQANFREFGLSFQIWDSAHAPVQFVKGFFNDSLPLLREDLRLSVLRADGDMYESTSDILYNLYPKVVVGGFVIIDDWAIGNARKAVKDFWLTHGVAEQVIPVDKACAYFRKTTNFMVNMKHYEDIRRETSTLNNKLLLRPNKAKSTDIAWREKCLAWPYPCMDEFEFRKV